MVKYGYIAIGIVDEHSIDNPLFQWSDPLTPYDVTVAGLTSEGSAVFYGVDCPVLNPRELYPRGFCNGDFDCNDVPNTQCFREPEPHALPTTTIKLMTCRCKDGYEPIPGKKLFFYKAKLEFDVLLYGLNEGSNSQHAASNFC